MVVTKDRPHGPGRSVAMLIVVECEDHSAIQVPPGMAHLKIEQSYFVLRPSLVQRRRAGCITFSSSETTQKDILSLCKYEAEDIVWCTSFANLQSSWFLSPLSVTRFGEISPLW